MAKKETTNKTGVDKPWYRTPGGVIHPVTNAENDIFGTPAAPSYRMGPGPVGSGNLPDGDPRTSANPVAKRFFSKKG